MLRQILSLFRQHTSTLTLTEDVPAIERQYATHLLASETVDAEAVVAQHPPEIEHAKKRVLFDLALAHQPTGSTGVRRFSEIPLPTVFRQYSSETKVVAKKGYFGYVSSDNADHWYMNFAHHDLFSGYGNFMFAQDEIQVAEHPVLASIRELMLRRTDHLRPLTVEDGLPTPVLFRAVPRALSINTSSIYGARFARAEESTIRECAMPLDPMTQSNILAIEAPISSGNEIYSRAEIELALSTAFSGFRAVVLASVVDSPSVQPVVIHTGNWGCGAYGGNRQLMLSIQIMAAELAGISKIVFHCGYDNPDDVATFNAALRKRFKFRAGVKTATVVQKLINAGVPWGVPDGN